MQQILLWIVKKLIEYVEGYHISKDPVRKAKNGTVDAKL
jgi:hypothetical protein